MTASLPDPRSSQHLQLFRARYLVPISLAPQEDGALAVRGDRIVAVGPFPTLQRAYPGAAVTDFGDAILLPPLANAHTHLELTHFPEWAAAAGLQNGDREFTDWLLGVIGIKRQLSPAQLRASLAEGLKRSLQAGTAVVGDNLSCFELGALYKDTPLFGRVFLEAIGRSESRCGETLAELDRLSGEGIFGSLASGVAPHAPYTVSPEFMRQLAAFAGERQLPLSLHIAESAAEVELCRTGQGALVERMFPLADWPAPPALDLSPVALLDACGLLGPQSLLVHGVQVNEADVELIAARGAAVVLCPGSNRTLAVGTAPAASYLAAGVPLALGTDSLASNASLSVWEELACAASVYADQLAPATLLEMATWQGAKLLGVGEECGALRPGHGAHFQVLQGTLPTSVAGIEEFLVSHGCQCRIAAHYRGGEDLLPSLA